MPTPGPQVFQKIRQALEAARSNSEQVASTQNRLKAEIERLVSDRGAALLELAKHDLPDLRRETIHATFTEIQKDLLLIVERKEQALAELQGRIDRLIAEEQKTSQARSEADTLLTRQLTEQSRLQARVQSELKSHAEFPKLSQQAVEAEAALHRDEKRVADVQAESRDKLPPYERSALFQYLYRRHYLTPDYNQRGWTRRIDRWVSDLIGYPTAQRGYEFLKTTPDLMQKELERRRNVFHQLMSQVEQIEAEVATTVGLTQTIADAKSAREQRDRFDENLAKTRQLTVQAQTELAAVHRDQCQFYQAALDRYRAFLDATETAVLAQKAETTPDTRDDEIVSRIRLLNQQIETLKPQLNSTTEDVATTVTVSEGLEFIVRRMEQSNFQEDRSRFDDQLRLDQLLDRHRQGVLSRDALWTEIKQHQQFERTQTETTVMDIVNHPMTHVLAEAMVQVVGAALQNGVNRSIQRRSGSSGPFGSSGASWSAPSFPDIPAPTWVGSRPSAPSTPSPSTGGGEYKTVDRF